MTNTSSSVLSKDKVISSGVVELFVTTPTFTGWQAISAFKDVVVNYDRQAREATITDDGQFGGKVFRDDVKVQGNFLAIRNPWIFENVFSLDIVSVTLGAPVAITDELTFMTYKRADLGVYECLLENFHEDGKNPATVNQIELVDKDDPSTILIPAASLTEGVDFYVGVNNGHTSIGIIKGGALDTYVNTNNYDPKLLLIKADYTYTPATSFQFKSGKAKLPAAKRIRITEVPDWGVTTITSPYVFQLEMIEADIVTGPSIQFPDILGENEDFELAIEIEARQGIESFTNVLIR